MIRNICIAICIAVGLISCSTAPDFEVQKYLDLEFNVANVGNEIELSEDRIRITEVKFLIDNFTIADADTFSALSSENLRPMLYAYNENFSDNFLVISIPLFQGIPPLSRFKSEIRPARSGDFNNDSDFIFEGEFYSIVIRGFFNQEEFVFRSDAEIDLDLTFNPVEPSERRETIIIRKHLDARDLFVNSSDNSLYSPFVEEDMEQVIALFEQIIEIQAETVRRY